jgi:hypothetical protein
MKKGKEKKRENIKERARKGREKRKLEVKNQINSIWQRIKAKRVP